MAFTVGSLIEGRPAPATAAPDEPAGGVVKRMMAREYSQLPVVAEDGRVLGMISHESVLRAMVTFGCGIEKLCVRDAVSRHRHVAPEAGMADLLEGLGHSPAILVIDRGGALVGIVTDFDITMHFRADLEDRMHVADIEIAVRQFVAGSYGGEAVPDLVEAIRQGSAREHRSPFQKALREYLGAEVQLDQARAAKVFEQHFVRDRAFDQLTLSEFSTLFTDAARWEQNFAPLFGDKRSEIQRLLDQARKARNAIAHLRELDPEQRELLKFCAEWLGRTQEANDRRAPALPVEPEAAPVTQVEVEPERGTDAPSQPPVDSVGESEGTYAPLAAWLQQIEPERADIAVGFADVERILGRGLPPSARRHRAWWANDNRVNAHAQTWLEVGWKAAVNLTAEQVRFTRTAGREDAYIRFFSDLLDRLRGAGESVTVSPHGGSFQWIAGVFAGATRVGWLAVSFARGGRFRTELYLDGGEQGANKHYFDALYAKRDAIEQAVGAPLAWERLDDQRASRVARYREGRVTDAADSLTALQLSAVQDLLALRGALGSALREISDQPAGTLA